MLLRIHVVRCLPVVPSPTAPAGVHDFFHLLTLDTVLMQVGDRLDTDILFGKNGGLSTCLVLSGVTSEQTLNSPDNKIHPDYYMVRCARPAPSSLHA